MAMMILPLPLPLKQCKGRLWQAKEGFGALRPCAARGFGRPEKALAGQRRLWRALAGQRRLWQAKEGFGRLTTKLV